MLRLSPFALFASALSAVLIAAGCGGGSETTTSSVPFAPEATLRAVGGTVRASKPDFVLHVATRPGDANIRSLAVNLPPVVLVDVASIGGFCSERQLEEEQCAGHQRLGVARALSPAYEKPIAGPVYAVTGSGRLPHLAYLLGGPTEIELEGRVVSKQGRIQAGVEDLPDTPLREFQFTLEGGRHGYLILSRDVCARTWFAEAKFTSQDGQRYEAKVPLEANCKS